VEKVPVVGPFLSQVLGFYAKNAVASGEAIVKIQAKIIEMDLTTSFPRPEMHLYTVDEVKASLRVGDPAKVRDLLQVRRLIFLIHADSAGKVTDIRRP